MPCLPGGLAARVAMWAEAGLDAAAVLFFPVLVLLPRGIATLTAAAGLCGAGLVAASRRKQLSPTLAAPAALFGALLVWGVISASWSPDPLRSLVVAARLAGSFVTGLALIAAAGQVVAPRRLTVLFLLGLALGIVLTAVELATAGGLSSLVSNRTYRETRLNQVSVLFAVLLMPAGVVLMALGRRIAALAMIAAAAGMVCILAGTAAKAALFAGLPAGLLLYRWCRHVARVAAVIAVAVIVTAPLTFARLERVPGFSETADNIKVSAGHRLLIWSFAGDRIAERPLAGWGLDASRVIPGGRDPIRAGETWMPLHPHNAALQLWLELGVPGVALFALLVARLWVSLATARWPPLFSAAAGAALTVALIGCFGTYGIWQEWWLGALWFALFTVLVMARIAGQPAGPALKAGRSPFRSG